MLVATIIMGVGLFVFAFYIGYLRNVIKEQRSRADMYKTDYEIELQTRKMLDNQVTDQRRAITQLQRDLQALLPNNQPVTSSTRKKKTKELEIKEPTKIHDIDIYEE